MSKETKQFDVAIIDYSDASVRLERRSLPSDIQTEELEELLVAEDKYNPSTCYVMFSESITVEDYRPCTDEH